VTGQKGTSTLADRSRRDSEPTLEFTDPLSSVVVVGSERLQQLTQSAMNGLPHAVLAERTDLAGLANKLSRSRPLLVLVEDYLYDFDPEELEGLARGVGARLVVARAGKPLPAGLGQQVLEALHKRRSQP
jgi:hypothetical protein